MALQLLRVLSQCLLFLLGTHLAHALQLESASAATEAVVGRREARMPYRQELVNMGDLQYTSEFFIGNQRVQGIFDTGSFELVTFSTHCDSCFKARAYDSATSSTYSRGSLKEEQAYGSGSCQTEDAFENVTVGPFVATSQAFWQATSCNMPLLKEAAFNAIVGIGPPGQPEFTARTSLARVNEMMSQLQSEGKQPSEELEKAKATLEKKLESSKQKPSMLENFDVKVFSVCLGRKSGAAGYLIWNDRVPAKDVMVAKVVGSIMWGVKLGRFALHHEKRDKTHTFDCESGCGAVVDTGTSLIGVPSNVYMKVFSHLSWKLNNCNDLSNFPDLVLNVGGNDLYLPPEAYVGRLYGQVPHDVKKFFPVPAASNTSASANFADVSERRGRAMCQLLLMDLGSQKTQFGPMYILGMPFFREFYTTFDQGTGRNDRTVYMTPADNECRPSGLAGGSLAIERDFDGGKKYRRQREPGTIEPRWVDASKLRVPQWLRESSAAAENSGSSPLSF